jgi:hypothetical protein
MQSYTVRNTPGGFQLPSGLTLSAREFVARAGKCGFDELYTAKVLSLLAPGGYWPLTLTSDQIKIFNQQKPRAAAQGF